MPDNVLDVEGLRQVLKSPSKIEQNSFSIAQSLCVLEKTAEPELFQDILLRALEYKEKFGGSAKILDSLLREVGLFPFLDPKNLSLADKIAYEFHRPQNMPPSMVFHRPQARVYREILRGVNVVLSAPTSFGKSLIIDGIILSDKYTNILIIVPTIALIDETRRRISSLKTDYKIITHTSQVPAEKNIYVLTQERVFEGVDLDSIDFFVIDEFYKLSPEKGNESRSSLLNQAFYTLNKKKKQFYMLGPNIEKIAPAFQQKVDCIFLHEPYNTVASEVELVEVQDSEFQTLIDLCKRLKGQTIIYCQSPPRAALVVKELLSSEFVKSKPNRLMRAVEWLTKEFHPEWYFAKALIKGIGIHHGKIPRALSQFVVHAFDNELIDFLVCTSSLIEGVNTKARNIIIFDNKINQTKFDYFTFNNIKGRSGRMFKHFVGHVYLFHPPPQAGLPIVDVQAFTQSDDTPESLLIQLDEEDLTSNSLERLSEYRNQDLLSYSTLKANIGIDPALQLKLAFALSSKATFYHPQLNWHHQPTASQLKLICELIYEYFNGRKIGGASAKSAKQLAFKIESLRRNLTTRQQIEQELNFVQGNTPEKVDAAIQSILDFSRLWANFNFPRLLRAVSRIQQDVFSKKRYRTYGNYDYFAERVEHLFLDPAIFALDEYGIPLQLAIKLEPYLKPDKNLDLALYNLKKLDPQFLDLSNFEKALITNAQQSLPFYIPSEKIEN